NLAGSFSEFETRQTEWPQGTARWNQLVRSGPVALFALGATLRRREGITIAPSASGEVRGRTVSGQFNPDLTLGLRNGITANMSYLHAGQTTENSANRTENIADQWTGTVSHSIRLPASLSARRRQLRVSVYGQRLLNQTCLFRASSPADGCRKVADVRRSTLNGGFTTEVLPSAEAGLNFQYVLNDIRQVDQRTTQLSIVASLRLQLSSGNLR
ncbi:MAG: hypothetical protein ABJB33_02555, partial [Gemmatimonadota bacterium]